MNEITIVGNLTADPELRFTPSGSSVLNFVVLVNERWFDKQRGEWVDRDPVRHQVVAWNRLADNLAESLNKGTAVIVTGKPRANNYTRPDGTTIYRTELWAETGGPDLRYATAQVTKNPKPAAAPAESQPAEPAESPAVEWAEAAARPATKSAKARTRVKAEAAA